VRAVPWHSRLLRGERVFVKVNPRGEPAAGSDGRVEMIYRPGGKVYRAGVRNLEADSQPQTLSDSEATGPGDGKGERSGESRSGGGATRGGTGSGPVPGDALIVYTDGACTGNPGPAGIGIVILDGKERREISEYLGPGTNNIAELMAIVRALEELPR
jgi:ribonuclease HI